MEPNLTEAFLNNFNGAVTLTDENAMILYMNEKAQKTFEKQGGKRINRHLPF